MKDVAAIQRSVYPAWVRSADGWRHQLLTAPERIRQLFLVAAVGGPGGQVAGWALAATNPDSPEAGDAILRLAVAPGRQGQGIGTTLYLAAERHLRDISAATVRIWIPDEPKSISFATHRGYDRRRAMVYSRCDPATLPPMPPVPQGITLTGLGSAGPEVVYEWDMACAADEPRDGAFTPMAYREWKSLHWEAPDHRADLGVAALEGGTVVAATAVEVDGARSVSGFTGVLPGHRGRGLAKLVKSASLRRVAEAGITEAFTSNDAENAPMLAVNDWLGYRPFTKALLYVSNTGPAHSSPQ